MKLTSAQLEQLDRDGYLFFPSTFSPEEIKVLTDDVPKLYAQHRPENVGEKGTDAGHDTTTTSYPWWPIDHATITRLIERGGLVAPKGPAGSMIMFHSCLVHASTSNLSPWNRVSVYLSLCAVSNHIRRLKRPEYIAHRDFSPIQCLPDDCLLRDYDVPLPWKDGTPEEALKPLVAA